MADTGNGFTPPHDDRAEQVVLGCLLTSPKAYVQVVEKLKGRHFYTARHEVLYDRLIELSYNDRPTDPVSVFHTLSPQEQARIGGIDYLYELARSVPVAANVGSFASIVRDHATRRSIHTAGLAIAQGAVNDPSADVSSIVADAQHVFEDSLGDVDTSGLASIQEIFEPAVQSIEDLSKGGTKGVPTGFLDLDEKLTGFQPAQFIIVAARPAVGKALALDTPLPTPGGGFTTMGEVEPGNVLLGSAGQPVPVTGTSPIQVDRECFTVSFSDDGAVVCDADHEWTIHSRAAGGQATITTRTMASLLAQGADVSVHGGTDPGQTRHVRRLAPARSVPVKCLTVATHAAPDSLFLAGPTGVPTHNSTLAMDFARAAAIHNHIPTLFVSLEMDRIELTKRLISAESRVPLNALRTGDVDEAQWRQIGKYASAIMNAPLFIDDSAMITPHEIRAKAQQLKARHGLGLIIVDYIQLLSSGRRVESRQQEVSEFSRGMKIIAKALEVPVIGLSQLNRGLEQRADKKPQMSDLRESGCMTADTTLATPDGTVTFAELLERGWEGVHVWSVTDTHEVVAAPVTNVFPSGTKPTYDLTLSTGQTVEATGNHKFLTQAGWTRLDELTPGTLVGSVAPGQDAPAMTWARVVTVTSTGRDVPVYDATVDGTHNFVANGIVAHNSLEQDADVILLLHREDVHDAETPRAGEADVHVAKQRNGPTGTITLAAQLQYSRFTSMAPDMN